jgi:hypothetical protein
MAKRIIESHPAVLAKLQGKEVLETIRVSGGRAVSAEIVVFHPGLISGVSNGALCAAFGADIVHLNHYDVEKPQIAGMISTNEGKDTWAKAGVSIFQKDEVEGPPSDFLETLGFGRTIWDLRQSIGRVCSLSLEVDFDGADAPKGRLSTPETARKAIDQGAAYLTLVGTPAHSTEVLANNFRKLRQSLGESAMLVAGRMPWGGSRVGMPDFLHADEVEVMIKAGADMVMLPAPGTMPNATMEAITDAVSMAHKLGAVAEITIGTTQESSDEGTVRRLALDSRLTGADLFQIGDGGYSGMTIPENILAFAIAIKGRRHTYRRMALQMQA